MTAFESWCRNINEYNIIHVNSALKSRTYGHNPDGWRSQHNAFPQMSHDCR